MKEGEKFLNKKTDMDIKKYKKEQEKRSPSEKLSDAVGASREEKKIKRTTSDGFMVKREEKGEKKGIKEYSEKVKESKGKKKEVYKEILSDEKKHLKKLKKI